MLLLAVDGDWYKDLQVANVERTKEQECGIHSSKVGPLHHTSFLQDLGIITKEGVGRLYKPGAEDVCSETVIFPDVIGELHMWTHSSCLYKACTNQIKLIHIPAQKTTDGCQGRKSQFSSGKRPRRGYPSSRRCSYIHAYTSSTKWARWIEM